MAKHAVFNDAVIARARGIVGGMKYDDPVMVSISVLLAGTLHLTCEEIGSIFEVAESTVSRMNERFRQGGYSAEKMRWGGDRRSFLKKEQEAAVLAALEKEAAAGEIVVIGRVTEELEKACGKEISIQTAYNVLARNEWRKVSPYKEHPKADAAKQEDFQKKHFRRRYIWLPGKPLQKEKI